MNTAVFKKTVSKLDGQLDKLLEVAQSTGTQQDIVEEIKALKEKNQSENFKVLVMGGWGTGKSTMINALIGEPIFPRGMNPTTAIITEIKYGADKKVILYPKKGGGWKGGDAPFEVPVTELEKYLTIQDEDDIGDADGEYANTKDGNIILSPFERVEIFVPLDILKDGIEIIDSPGMNDPKCYGDITLKYLSNVHAVIYCVNGSQPCSASQEDEIEELHKKNYKIPIFVITRYDQIRNNEDPKGLEKYRKSTTAKLAKHTDLVKPEYTSMLDGNGIFFVDSRGALQAKHASPCNMQDLKESGYQDFERYLSDYLIKCKGDERFRLIVEGIRTVGNDVIKSLNEEYNAADLSLEEFEQRVKDNERRVESAREQAKHLLEFFEFELEKILTELKSTYRALLNEAYYQVDTWRSTYQCSVEKQMFHPHRTAKAIAEEFGAHMLNQFEGFMSDCNENVLKPELVRKIRKMGEKLKNSAKNFDATLNDIKVGLNLTDASTVLTHASTDEMASTGSKFASLVYGLVTLDVIGASAGMTVGVEGLIKRILINIGFNFPVMLLFSVMPPYHLIIAGQIAQLLITSGGNWRIIEKKVCNKVDEEFKRILFDPNEVDILVDKFYDQLKTEFAKLSEEAKKFARADVEQIECETKQLLDDKKKGEEAVKARKAKIITWKAEVNTIIDTAAKIRTEALA